MTTNESESDHPIEQIPAKPTTLIGAKAATILYVLLLVAAFVSLHGKALVVAIIIVSGLATKSYLHHWQEKKDG